MPLICASSVIHPSRAVFESCVRLEGDGLIHVCEHGCALIAHSMLIPLPLPPPPNYMANSHSSIAVHVNAYTDIRFTFIPYLPTLSTTDPQFLFNAIPPLQIASNPGPGCYGEALTCFSTSFLILPSSSISIPSLSPSPHPSPSSPRSPHTAPSRTWTSRCATRSAKRT